MSLALAICGLKAVGTEADAADTGAADDLRVSTIDDAGAAAPDDATTTSSTVEEAPAVAPVAATAASASGCLAVSKAPSFTSLSKLLSLFALEGKAAEGTAELEEPLLILLSSLLLPLLSAIAPATGDEGDADRDDDTA